ncbi:MAG: DUF3467 domain-containing protein [Pirellulaceae bacterium]|nr:DUF3467 domain-containing protein [Pirellulaceae bacterium]
MQLYRGRWGELPNPRLVTAVAAATPAANPQPVVPPNDTQIVGLSTAGGSPQAPEGGQSAADGAPGAASGGSQAGTGGQTGTAGSPTAHSPAPAAGGTTDKPPRHPSAEEIYDDLKVRDELLSGVYANAVMIGHGPHEFSFDFITNFYPHSAVSARVFLAAGQIPRLYDSLKGTWEQLRARLQPPPPPPPSPPLDWPG